MHWTTLSDVEIFTWPNEQNAVAAGVRQEVVMGHARLIVLRQADGTATVERLISPYPGDYLNPAWQPGQPYRV
ncbi:YlzJ-like family protein [Alicyclobacillus acidiphilus]|jgi:hypothetical protein|uniref:YlzJ-like family protein n=1 Tax=Alicyclobacillus acidiphilus TaxID=182455 RepID=UPI00082CCEE5|nr:YlzJ-like family protein [Alicyclobacillus acidiphilus]